MDIMESYVSYRIKENLSEITNDMNYNTTVLHETPLRTFRHISVACQMILTASYVIGIVGNVVALIYLCEKKSRNRKHVFMLRCLSCNGLIALIGMLIQMNLELYLPQAYGGKYCYCVLRVIWRMFGLVAGCIAIVMAVERFLALTHPFLYQKHITYSVIRRAILALWLWAALLSCLPFLGFGIFYDADKDQCVRYRDAKEPVHVAYAFLFFAFGVLLWFCLVWCNLGVIRVLCRIGCRGKKLVRRISRNCSKGKNMVNNNAATADEIAFAKLMAWLCVSFLIGWMPQMISIPLAYWLPKLKFSRYFLRTADVLMALHYTLDPYIYVIFRGRRHRTYIPEAFQHLCCCNRHHKDDENTEQMQQLHQIEGAALIKPKTNIPCCGNGVREIDLPDHTMNTATVLVEGENSIAV